MTNGDSPILTLEGVTKTYGALTVVDDISLNLRRGEFLTLLGPSGSGKTTTLMMIAGLTTPSKGVISSDGQALNAVPPYKRQFGMVFQNYALFPHMTVGRNVAFPLEMRGERSAVIRDRVREALTLVGLPDFEDRMPQKLSGGQQQRVALARAMVFRPRLLLMDEPLGALDKKLREQMQLEIMRLHRNLGVSVIYVTHDQEEALVMSDRIAVFNHGRIDQIGSPTELYERPRSRFVADFLGESNFIPGVVKEANGTLCRVNGGDHSFTSRTDDRIAVGQQAILAVRPERVRLAPPLTDHGPQDNHALGTVQTIVYLGRLRKYIVTVGDGLEMAILQQAEESRHAFAPGEQVKMMWKPEDSTVFPGDGGLPSRTGTAPAEAVGS